MISPTAHNAFVKGFGPYVPYSVGCVLSPNASSENDLACDDGKVNQCFIDVSMLTDFVSDKLVNGYYV